MVRGLGIDLLLPVLVVPDLPALDASVVVVVVHPNEHERGVMLRDQIGDRLIEIRLVNDLCE